MTETVKKLDPIQEALKRSQEQAAQAATALPAVAASTGGAVAVQGTPMAMSMDQMLAGGMSVDNWLKVKEDGLKIGDSSFIVGGPLRCSIDMTEGSGFVLKYTIKGGLPAKYASTVDMVTATGGGSWIDAVGRIKALHAPKDTNPYRSVDLPFRVEVAEVKDMSGKVFAKKGDTVGYATSTTNWPNWVTFYRAVVEAGLIGKRVLVDLSAEKRSGNGNGWGVVKMDFVGELQESE